MNKYWLFAKLSVLSTALFAILIILTAIITGKIHFEFSVDAWEFYGIMFLAFWVYSLPVGLIYAGLAIGFDWQKSPKSAYLSAITLSMIAFLVLVGIQLMSGFKYITAEWQTIITIVVVAGVVGVLSTALLPKPISSSVAGA